MSLIEVKLRPAGPWRVGDRAGDRERVDLVYHSDALYSAVTHAMRVLGWLGEWLEATAGASGDPAVRFSSLFPFSGKTRLVAPPRSVWPPAQAGKLYLQGARLIPLEIVKSGVVDESRWTVDGESECLIPLGSGAPFRVVMRSAAAVDRLTGTAESHRTACLEFAPNAGWWGVFSVTDPVWEGRVKSALRLLADSGFGAERSRGWGRASEPRFSEASHLFASAGAEKCWWLLSLYSPHQDEVVEWTRSEYTAVVRGGWTDSPAGVAAKKLLRMMEEGSVLAAEVLRGRAVDVAPDGFPHSVYRAGFALAMPAPHEILLRVAATSEVRQPVSQADQTELRKPELEAAQPLSPQTEATMQEGTAAEPEPELSPASPVAADVAGTVPEAGSGGTAAEPEPELLPASPVAADATGAAPEVEELPERPADPAGTAPEAESGSPAAEPEPELLPASPVASDAADTAPEAEELPERPTDAGKTISEGSLQETSEPVPQKPDEDAE